MTTPTIYRLAALAALLVVPGCRQPAPAAQPEPAQPSVQAQPAQGAQQAGQPVRQEEPSALPAQPGQVLEQPAPQHPQPVERIIVAPNQGPPGQR